MYDPARKTRPGAPASAAPGPHCTGQGRDFPRGWHEGLRRTRHPQRGRGGPRRLRQDLAGLRAAFRRRGGQPPRPGRRRHGPHRLRSRRDRAQDQPADRAGLRRVEEDQDQPAGHAGLRATSSPRPARRCAWPTRRWWWSTPSPASRCRPRRSGATRSTTACRALVVVNRMDRERASFERALRERSQNAFGRGCVPLAAAARRGEGLWRRGRPAQRQGAGLRRRRLAASSRRGDLPADAAGARRGRPREAGRDGRRERRGPARGVLREGYAGARDARARGCAAPCSAGKLFPVLPASAARNVGVHAAARRDRGPAALAGRSAARRDGQDGAERPPTNDGASLGLRLQDASPTRTPAASRSSGSTRACSSPTARCTTPPATWPSAWARCCCRRASSSSRSPRSGPGTWAP